MPRSALLVRCDAEEADRIRIEAHKERRTISAYVLDIAARAVAVDDHKFSKLDYNPANEVSRRRDAIVSGRRTAILVRCAAREAEQIREAARRRDTPINSFVLQALKSVWDIQVALHLSASASSAPEVA